MKKPVHWSQSSVRVHEAKDDRDRTWSGKTASRKIRNEPRHQAALERAAQTQHTFQAHAAKRHLPR